MMRIAAILPLILTLSACGKADNVLAAAAVATAFAPLQDVDDFNVVLPALEQGAIAQHTFRFLNHSGQPLKIVRVVPSCSCSSAKMDRLAVAPNEEGQLTVSVDTFARTGLLSAAVSVEGLLANDTAVLQTFKISVPVGQIYAFYVDSIKDCGEEIVVALVGSALGTSSISLSGIAVVGDGDAVALGSLLSRAERHQLGRTELVERYALKGDGAKPGRLVEFSAVLNGHEKRAKGIIDTNQ